jgi:hypothetical protein
MIRKSIVVGIACAAPSTTALAQGAGGGGSAGGGAGVESAAGASAKTATASASRNSGPSAPFGIGTHNTTTGANVKTNGNQPPTTNGMSPSAAQAQRNAGVSHAANGLPIGSAGTG